MNYENFKEAAKDLLILYVVAGSILMSERTGHVSADIYTGISKPTVVDRTIVNGLEKLADKFTRIGSTGGR